MKTWRHAPLATFCGGCGEPIAKGAAMLVLSGGTWSAVRCTTCAADSGPADLAVEPLTRRPVLGVQLAERVGSVRALAVDWKHAQAGDRA